mmetsp:Transcript_36923/g.73051  ORF Transcript_36923/g.73051 Transcript_36923/m.73051 type:complete len:252 (-) Transcript_36923:33-788(-)
MLSLCGASSRPLLLTTCSILLQALLWALEHSSWADDSGKASAPVGQQQRTVELCILGVATGCILPSLPPIIALFRDGPGKTPMRSAASALLLLASLSCTSLGWYNAFQDSYYLESCHYSSWRRSCLAPRYKIVDIVYNWAYRDTCVMARMGDPTSFEVKEKQCYIVFTTRLPMCISVAAKCLLAAIVIGGLIAYDAQPTFGQTPPDEATLLAEAQVAERMQENDFTASQLRDRRPNMAALADDSISGSGSD